MLDRAETAKFVCVLANIPRPEPAQLVVQRFGAVVAGSGAVPWLLLEEGGAEHPGVSDFLRQMVASDYGASSVRSYALALLRWLRFLRAVGVQWDRAGREDTRDFVLWMRAAAPARPASRGRPGASAHTG
ncbi:site-specific integrase [Sphaerisporangium sp. NPDC051017]|uniref:site-specific integrase n=1 Tax=Sphaerisporangium sp. NPDC051017 TaxID=3154636 RepID=UPI00341F557B